MGRRRNARLRRRREERARREAAEEKYDLRLVVRRAQVRLVPLLLGVRVEVLLSVKFITNSGLFETSRDIELSSDKVVREWDRLGPADRDRSVFGAVMNALSHEVAETLYCNGRRVIDPHPQSGPSFPDQQVWTREQSPPALVDAATSLGLRDPVVFFDEVANLPPGFDKVVERLRESIYREVASVFDEVAEGKVDP